MQPSDSASRLAISHPYPPSYHSNRTPSPSGSYTTSSASNMPPSQSYAFGHQRRQDERPHDPYLNPPSSSSGYPPVGPIPSASGMPPSHTYTYGHQRRPDERFHDPYLNPPSSSTGYSPAEPIPSASGMPPSQPYAFEQQRRQDERFHDPYLNPPSSSSKFPSTDPSRPPMRHRSTSDSSLHPVLGGKSAGYPEGWSKADEEAERDFLARGMINWGEMRSWRFWIRKEWWSESMLFCALVQSKRY